MSRRGTILGIVASVGVLTVGWQVGAAGNQQASTSAGTSDSGGTTNGSATAEPGSGSATAEPGSGSATSGSAEVDGTYTGDSVSTRFGDVQVAVTIAGGQITDVTAIALTDKERKSIQISNRAAPILRSEVLAAQSTRVSTVSGATYTSDAYLDSLQSALDQAGF